MRTVILLCGVALVAVGCSAPCPTEPSPVKEIRVKYNNMEWICPLGTGMVIRTGVSMPWEGCYQNNGT